MYDYIIRFVNITIKNVGHDIVAQGNTLEEAIENGWKQMQKIYGLECRECWRVK